jgi:hypothetical protein
MGYFKYIVDLISINHKRLKKLLFKAVHIEIGERKNYVDRTIYMFIPATYTTDKL